MVQSAPHSGTIPSKALQAAVDAIKAVTDLLPDGGALTALLTSIASILLDTGTTLPATLATIQGVGWTTETLKAIKDAVDAVIPGVGDATQAKQDAIEAKLDDGVSGLAALKTLIDILTAYVDTEVAAILLDTGTTLPATLATIAGYIDTEIAAIETKLDGASGLAAIKAVIDAILVDTDTTLEVKLDAIKAITDALPDAGALTTLQNTVTGIQNDLDNAVDGLGVLKALIDAVQATSNTIEGYTDILDDAVNGLANIKSLIDTLQGTANTIEGYTDILDDAVNGLANIKSLIDTMQGNVTDILLDTGTTIPGTITTLQTTATGIQNDLDNATDGLGALKALIDTLQGNVTDILADTGELQTDWADGGRLDLLIDAITTHLTDIKGAGWTNETLKAIKDAVDAVIPGVGDATQAKQDAIEAKLDIPANFMADLTTLETRLSAIRAGYLDQLDFNLQEAIAALQTDLDNPNQYKANVLALALEATLGTHDTDIKALLATIAGYIDTEVGAIETKLDTPANFMADLTTLETRLSAIRAGYLDQLDFNLQEKLNEIDAEVEGIGGVAMRGTDNAALAASWTAALATALGNYTAALATALGNYTAARAGYLDELGPTNIPADTDPKVMGRSQIFEKSITSAANAGDANVATITDQPCLIEAVVIHADAAQTGDLTSAGIFGGAGKVITFIAAADALQADLDAIDKQVYWEGKVRLAATKTIVISLVGSGADNVDLTVIIKYRASVSGGYLA